MALKIVHDGSLAGDVQENCCMCRKPTRFWWGTGARNVALCPDCAKTTKARDLPTKADLVKKERRLTPRIATFGELDRAY
jgi:hypothetical protein